MNLLKYGETNTGNFRCVRVWCLNLNACVRTDNFPPPLPPVTNCHKSASRFGFLFKSVEARGVEPLSIKRSARPSTCLGDLSFQSDAADRHATRSIAATESIHLTPRSPRRKASLLPACPFLAGVSPDTSRHVRPRELDLRNLRLSF